MSGLKGDFINAAYSRMRISGLTRNPSPADTEVALERLENLASEWNSIGICAGYSFEETPDPSTPHNVPREYWNAFETSLAARLLSDFGKQPNDALLREQRTSFARLTASTAETRETQYPSRQPVGNGNRLWGRYRRYYRPEEEAPISCETIKMRVGEINDFVENFSDYLALSEDVSTVTVTAENTNIVVVSSALTTPEVDYRIRADGEDASVGLDIEIETTLGRKEKRTLFFEVTE
jgi:hypothetical protein